MYLKLIIGDSMGNIAKEVSLVSGEKIMKQGGKQLAQASLLEQIEFVTMEKSTNVQHETILGFVIDLMGNNFLKNILKKIVIFVCLYMVDMTIPMITYFHKIVYHTFLVIYVSCLKP